MVNVRILGVVNVRLANNLTPTKRPLWFWTKHTKICVGAAFALVLLLLLVVYLTYSQKQLETTMDMMMELPD